VQAVTNARWSGGGSGRYLRLLARRLGLNPKPIELLLQPGGGGAGLCGRQDCWVGRIEGIKPAAAVILS
jgi:hypothetical protein